MSITSRISIPAADPARKGQGKVEEAELVASLMRLRARILRAARWMLRGLEEGDRDASDMVNESFCKVLESKGQLRGETLEKIEAWIWKTAKRHLWKEVKDRRARQRKRRPYVSIGPDGDRPGVDVRDDSASTPRTVIENALRSDALELARSWLTERDRKVLNWRAEENLTFDAIGARLDITEDGGRRAYERAIGRLRTEFDKAYQKLARSQGL